MKEEMKEDDAEKEMVRRGMLWYQMRQNKGERGSAVQMVMVKFQVFLLPNPAVRWTTNER